MRQALQVDPRGVGRAQVQQPAEEARHHERHGGMATGNEACPGVAMIGPSVDDQSTGRGTASSCLTRITIECVQRISTSISSTVRGALVSSRLVIVVQNGQKASAWDRISGRRSSRSAAAAWTRQRHKCASRNTMSAGGVSVTSRVALAAGSPAPSKTGRCHQLPWAKCSADSRLATAVSRRTRGSQRRRACASRRPAGPADSSGVLRNEVSSPLRKRALRERRSAVASSALGAVRRRPPPIGLYDAPLGFIGEPALLLMFGIGLRLEPRLSEVHRVMAVLLGLFVVYSGTPASRSAPT